MAKGYVICRIEVTDQDAYARYKEMSSVAGTEYGARFIVRGGEAENLEGSLEPERIVVLEFESMDAARRWYSSPEYTAAREVRQSAATSSFILVEGA